jgi:hypothetical protein
MFAAPFLKSLSVEDASKPVKFRPSHRGYKRRNSPNRVTPFASIPSPWRAEKQSLGWLRRLLLDPDKFQADDLSAATGDGVC